MKDSKMICGNYELPNNQISLNIFIFLYIKGGSMQSPCWQSEKVVTYFMFENCPAEDLQNKWKMFANYFTMISVRKGFLILFKSGLGGILTFPLLESPSHMQEDMQKEDGSRVYQLHKERLYILVHSSIRGWTT